METLRSLRQPAAWVVLIAIGADGLFAVLQMLVFGIGSVGGVPTALRIYAPSIMSPLPAALVLAAILPLVLVAPRPPMTKVLSIIGLCVVGGLGLISLLCAFVGLADQHTSASGKVLGFLGQLVSLAVVGVVVFVLLRIVGALGAGGPQAYVSGGGHTQITEPTGYAGVPAGQRTGLGGIATGPGAQPAAPQPGPGHQAGQPPRPDAGAMWGSARQAAEGSQVSSWGGGGWSGPPAPPQAQPAPHQAPQTPQTQQPQQPPQPPHQPGPQQQPPTSWQPQPSSYGSAAQPQWGGSAATPHSLPPQHPGSEDTGPAEDYTRIVPKPNP